MKDIPAIIYPDGQTASREEVVRKLVFNAMCQNTATQLNTPPKKFSFSEWTKRLISRQEERQEVLPLPERVAVAIKTDKPILLGLFGDVHAGGEDTNYARFGKDVEALTQAGGYSVTVGDLTDSHFFMPGVDTALACGDEQVMYAQSALGELAKGGRLLAGWGGDHDKWAADKMGAATLYQDFYGKFGAPYLEGVSYLTVNVDDGSNVVPYEMVGAHKHRGISVYNDAHASLRMEKDEARGADIAFTAHNHVKAYLEQPVKTQGGFERILHLLALGAYKTTDRYSRKQGWPRKGEASQGAFGVILSPGKKEIKVEWTIEKAVDALISQVKKFF